MNGTDQSVIRTLGEECEGIISPAHFAEGSDNPVTQKFVKDYEAKYGKIPSLYGFSMYSGAMWIDAALKKMGGKVEDREAFIDAVLKTELDGSPLGKAVKFDAYGNPIYDVYIRKVVKRADGKYWNVPIQTYPEVSQFWKYNPETYMKQPPYSRDFPGHQESLMPTLTAGRGHGGRVLYQEDPCVRADPDADRCGGGLRRLAGGRRRQPDRAARPAPRHHRPQRRRQDHLVQRHHRHGAADLRQDRVRRS